MSAAAQYSFQFKAWCAGSAALQQLTCDGHALAVQESLAQQVLEHSRDAANLRQHVKEGSVMGPEMEQQQA